MIALLGGVEAGAGQAPDLADAPYAVGLTSGAGRRLGRLRRHGGLCGRLWDRVIALHAAPAYCAGCCRSSARVFPERVRRGCLDAR